MIIKSYEVIKNKNNYNFFLFYGENNEYKKEIIHQIFKPDFDNKINTYDEADVIKNKNIFFEEILSQSFFENKKLIKISRVTDKLINIIEEIIKKKIDDTVIILIGDQLDKKSKLRNFFEKDKNTACVPFYSDKMETLKMIAHDFFKNKKIPISQEILNTIVEKTKYDRGNLKIELEKIDSYLLNKKVIDFKSIMKIINSSESDDFSNLANICLAKDKKNLLKILNQNNFYKEDSVIIVKNLLIKAKRIQELKKLQINNKTIEASISSYRPLIFWKDKELVKQQLKVWTLKGINKLVFSFNDLELSIKRNIENSNNIIFNFMFQIVETKNN